MSPALTTEAKATTPTMPTLTMEEVIERYWRRLYNFAFRMTLNREEAATVVEETLLRTYVGQGKIPPDVTQVEPWLLRIAAHVVEKRVSKGQDVSFDLLDETLRSEATRTDVQRGLNDPEKSYMLWELKQGCMTSVVNCLSPGERIAFVMTVMMGFSEEHAAKVLGISGSAYKVRLSRARKKVTDYLAPRCEHVEPSNPCHCPSRLGVALSKGFIAQPQVSEVRLRDRQPFGRYGSGGTEDAPARDVMRIYQTLPDVDAPEELLSKLHGNLTSGAWESMKKQSER